MEIKNLIKQLSKCSVSVGFSLCLLQTQNSAFKNFLGNEKKKERKKVLFVILKGSDKHKQNTQQQQQQKSNGRTKRNTKKEKVQKVDD